MKRQHIKLEVWQEAMHLVQEIYQLTQKFPKYELYGLASQMQKAAVSIPSNIAEGAARGSKKDFVRFLYIARGSLAELETQLNISQNLGYLTLTESLQNKVERLFAKTAALITRLKRDS